MQTLRFLLLIAVSAFAATACTTKPVLPEFGAADLDTLLTCPGGVCCHVSYRYVPILNSDASPALRAVEQANLNYFYELEGFTGSTADAAGTALQQIITEYAGPIPQGSVGADYEFSAEAEGTLVDTLIVYTISRASFTGGAHGIYGIECHNYSLAEGYELNAADLFGEDRLPRLEQLVRSKIYEQYEAANDEELSAQGFFPEYIALTENFTVTAEGVTFFYNPYEIGCYALGMVEVPISREELAEL